MHDYHSVRRIENPYEKIPTLRHVDYSSLTPLPTRTGSELALRKKSGSEE